MKFLNGILVFIGVLILILTALLIPVSALGYSVQELIFDKKNAFDLLETHFLDEDFLADLRWEVSEEVINTLEDESNFDHTFVTAMDVMNKKTRANLLEDVLSDKQIEKIFEDLFDEAHDWYAGNSREPELIIDTSDILNEAYGKRFDIAESLLKDLPQCAQAEAESYLTYFSRKPAYRYELPACNMSAPYDFEQLDYFGEVIGMGLDTSLEEIDITPADVPFKDIKKQIKTYRTYLSYSWIAGLALWAVGCLLVVRSWSGLRRALGQPAVYGGLLTLIMGATIRWLPGLFIDGPLNDIVDGLETSVSDVIFMELPRLIGESLITFSYGIIEAISSRLFIFGGVLFLFGLVLSMLGIFFKPRTPLAPAQAMTPPPAPAPEPTPTPPAEEPTIDE